MKNPSSPTVIWWRSRNRKRCAIAKHFVEGYAMGELVPACHVGTISAFELEKIRAGLCEIFPRSTDRWFIAPVCVTCHGRFMDLNKIPSEPDADLELL